MIKIIGIDPGLAATGIGIVRGTGFKVDGFSYGSINTSKNTSLPTRLDQIFSKLILMLKDEKPDLMVVEDVFSLEKYPKSGIILGKVSGVILLAGCRADLPSIEVSVREAKQILTGNGNATKMQLEKAVRHLVSLTTPIRPYHASDALSLALIGLFRYKKYIDQSLRSKSGASVISYIEGKLLKKEEERIIILANQIGYEILLPAIVMDTLKTKTAGEELSLYIYYHQTERQPKPVLIGFNLEIEKEFFQHFISVEDIGPLKAVKALNIPVREIASAIESKDAAKLKQLKGIGTRTAQKIIASLKGKMDKFALNTGDGPEKIQIMEDISKQMLNVLVSQLGHKANDAKNMIAEALKRNKTISTFEELFEEVYH